MCEKCRANGKGLTRVAIEVTVELENGVKEIPLRLFSGFIEGKEGLHLSMDKAHEKFLKSLMLEVIPILKNTFVQDDEELPEAIQVSRKEFLM